MPLPITDIWDSYAVYEQKGTSFGGCMFNGHAFSSQEISINLESRELKSSGEYRDYYNLNLVLDRTMDSIVFNISFSRYLDPTAIKVNRVMMLQT